MEIELKELTAKSQGIDIGVSLAWIPIYQINVDEYQRDLQKKRAAKLAKKFSWHNFQTVSVSRRSDGSLWAVDGQHGLEILRIQNYGLAPCIIVESDRISEAKAFIDRNSPDGGKRVSQREIQHAGLYANEEKALAADQFLKEFGLEVASGGHQPCKTNAIGFIRDNALSRPDVLRAAMGRIKSLWANEPEAWTRTILRGMCEVETSGKANQVGKSLHKNKVTPRRILDRCAGLQVGSGTGGGGSAYVKKAIFDLAKIEI